MAFQSRSLDDISRAVRGAFRQYLPGTDATLRQNVLYVIAKVVALISREYELRLEWLARQLFIATADGPHLERHCADFRIYRKPAATASGVLETTGLANAVYPSGLRWIVGDQVFAASGGATADGAGAVSFPVVAETAGATGNLAADTVLSLLDPSSAPTLAPQGTVSSDGFGGGADAETDEALRGRGLLRKGKPPQGGALTDYAQFALSVSGVTKAWAYRFHGGAGTVGVFFLFAGRDDEIPTPSDVAAVDAAILAMRLVRVDPVAIAPVAQAIDVTISGLSGDTPTIRAAISAAIRAALYARAQPGTDNEPFVVSRSWIGEAVSGVTGEDRHVLSSPSADITLTGGAYPVLGSVTYV